MQTTLATHRRRYVFITNAGFVNSENLLAQQRTDAAAKEKRRKKPGPGKVATVAGSSSVI